jgi:hypothetical protein
MSLSFAHLWQQQEGSDINVILLAPADAAASAALSLHSPQDQGDVSPPALTVASFPAHRTLFSNSAVLWSRVSGIS